jgi:hypothetical protein
MKTTRALRAVVLAIGLAALPARAADSPRYERRWFYAMFNLQVKESADRLVGLIEQAGKAGYNGVVLADYKLNVLGRVPDFYFPNVARVRAAAARAKVEIIPAVFPIGYSDGLLAHDPNLAEGLAVEGAPFQVKGRETHPVADPGVRIRNGDLEETRGDAFAGFSFQDEPGKATFADREVAHHGKVSCRIRNGGPGNARLITRSKVRPHACYRFSAWVKTQNLQPTNDVRLLAIGAGEGGRQLTFFEGGIEPTQDWRRIEVVFNSLDRSEVNLYIGLWGGASGTLWIDELQLEELALVNVLRRPGCPLTVTSDDGRTTYAEGKDYEPVADPLLGQVPFAGEYNFDHPGAKLRLTAASRIKDGNRLRVSWYHPVLTHGSQVMCCLSEPKVYELLRDQARRVNELLHPKTVLMSHDEIRVANWCRACRSRGLAPGALLADNVRRCATILGEAIPGAEVAVWSDMFDPHHNAVKDYYLVNGTLEGSWEGLPSRVIIANWNGSHPRESLGFFAGRGHKQVIAGYYDDGLENFRTWDAAAKGVPGVAGFMYTTWQAKYDLLDAYGRAMREAR